MLNKQTESLTRHELVIIRKTMSIVLPKSQILFFISEASEVLAMFIDTLRHWYITEVLHLQRPMVVSIFLQYYELEKVKFDTTQKVLTVLQ